MLKWLRNDGMCWTSPELVSSAALKIPARGPKFVELLNGTSNFVIVLPDHVIRIPF